MNRHIICLLILSFIAFSATATHNRAGEITYVQLDEFTYEITITTFTNTQPTSSGWPPVDRPQLEIDFGDNTTEVVPRVEMIDLPDYYRKNTYVTTHTFPGPGTYELVVEDPNRNEGVANIPNSVTVVFSIKTILQINPSLGPNSTPQLLSPPVDKAAKNRIFIHNPAAWDPDGDSLSYQLTQCTGEDGEPINGFEFPEGITMNAETGDLIWDKPTETGVYNVAILIEEWRDGVKIGQITRDLQIEVYETDNLPPEVMSDQEVCVMAGDSVSLTIKTFDPDGDDLVLTALGGVFELDEPAVFHDTVYSEDTVSATVSWQTSCQHIRRQPYLLVIKAEDEDEDIPLADLHHIRIWVNGPPTQFTNVEPTNYSVNLAWFDPACNVSGYELYRSKLSDQWSFDSCLTGIPAESGYSKIATLDSGMLSYTDNNEGDGLQQGFQYCYRIVPLYEDAFGYASAENCTTLIRGVPVITNVSVEHTDSVNGRVYIAWSRPTEIDTVENPGPYVYEIYRSKGLWGEQFGNEPVAQMNGLNDTVYTDSGLNTKNNAYSYKVELVSNGKRLYQPMTASSVWLQTYGKDNRIRLEATANVPWLNDTFAFYQVKNEGETLIGEADSGVYVHEGLQNEKQYNYYVKTTGRYTESGFVNPIINFSQKATGIPVDTVPPEAPQLTLSADCDAFYNILNWRCPEDEEVVNVNVYYAAFIDQPLSQIRAFPYPDTTEFFHQPPESISGCYAVSAVDSFGNESDLSTKMCIDSCDFYQLPNVITVNNDGKNDVFRPIGDDDVIRKTIAESEISIYSRWGSLVYKTTNPLILWEGRDQRTGKRVSNGVYYYICNLKERRISGIEERYKVGFVHVYYNK